MAENGNTSDIYNENSTSSCLRNFGTFIPAYEASHYKRQYRSKSANRESQL